MKKLISLLTLVILTLSLTSCGESKVVSSDKFGPATMHNGKVEFTVLEQLRGGATSEYFKCSEGTELYLVKVKLENKTNEDISLIGMFKLITDKDKFLLTGNGYPKDSSAYPSLPISLKANETVEGYVNFDVPKSGSETYTGLYFESLDLSNTLNGESKDGLLKFE